MIEPRPTDRPPRGEGFPLTEFFSVLAADHERIVTLCNKLTGGSSPPPDKPKQRKAIADELVMELSRHELVEEVLLWPQVRERVDDGAQICQIALEQEKNGKRVLSELVRVSPGNEEFDTLANIVAANLREHISYEQNIVWPKLRLRLADGESGQLGAEAERLSQRAPTRPHPHVPPDPRLLRAVTPVVAALDKARNALVRKP